MCVCVSVGGGVGTGIAVLGSQVFNLEAFVHKFRYVYVCICMHVWCACACVCVCVHKVKAHLLMALIRSLQGSVSYYIYNIHRLDRKSPEHDHNMIRTLNNCNYMFISSCWVFYVHKFLLLRGTLGVVG